MDADTHDQIYAFMSHFVQLLSFSYREFIEKQAGDIQDAYFNIESKQLMKFTRLCRSDYDLWHDIFCFNKNNIAELIDVYNDELLYISQLINNDNWQKLHKVINTAQKLVTKNRSAAD